MPMIDLNFRPSRAQLRQFGFIAFVAFGIIGGVTLWKRGLLGFDFGESVITVVAVVWTLGIVSAVLSLIAPTANRPLYVALMVVSYPIGVILSYLLLGILFFGILTPVGLLFRLIGRDALQRRFDPNASSYYVKHHRARDVGRYFRQF